MKNPKKKGKKTQKKVKRQMKIKEAQANENATHEQF
jgi:hypothetical protein